MHRRGLGSHVSLSSLCFSTQHHPRGRVTWWGCVQLLRGVRDGISRDSRPSAVWMHRPPLLRGQPHGVGIIVLLCRTLLCLHSMLQVTGFQSVIASELSHSAASPQQRMRFCPSQWTPTGTVPRGTPTDTVPGGTPHRHRPPGRHPLAPTPGGTPTDTIPRGTPTVTVPRGTPPGTVPGGKDQLAATHTMLRSVSLTDQGCVIFRLIFEQAMMPVSPCTEQKAVANLHSV